MSSEAKETRKIPSFAELGVCPAICKALEAMKYETPTAIQEKAIPHALRGADVIGLAETGSGKTAAFTIPMVQALLDNPQPLFGLIVSPTRELAIQIAEVVEAIGSTIDIKVTRIFGGVDSVQQAVALARKPHVIVATPGRLLDHLENTTGFKLNRLKWLVLDEADRLLAMDFEREISRLLELIPKDRRTLMFSATQTEKVSKLQKVSLREPVARVEATAVHKVVASLSQRFVLCPSAKKDLHLVHILSELKEKSIIVFSATVATVQRLLFLTRALGFSSIALHGQMHQTQRMGALAKFKAAQAKIMFASDVAARGLDIPHVDAVINYEVPLNVKDYLHRVGRTARAGRSGLALTMVTQYDVDVFQKIEGTIGDKMARHPCNAAQVMLLSQRVTEAQRQASIKMREEGYTHGRKGGPRRKKVRKR